jgi:hypothetical protein
MVIECYKAGREWPWNSRGTIPVIQRKDWVRSQKPLIKISNVKPEIGVEVFPNKIYALPLYQLPGGVISEQ